MNSSVSVSETIDESREKFERILDKVNEINLTLDASLSPSYSELDSFDDLHCRIKRVRINILGSEKSVGSDTCKSRTSKKIKLPPRNDLKHCRRKSLPLPCGYH